MSSAITKCPVCQTSFRVSETQLAMAGGSVRCGACLKIFKAEDHFISPFLELSERAALENEFRSSFETYVLDAFVEPSANKEQEPSADKEKERSADREREPATNDNPLAEMPLSYEADDLEATSEEYYLSSAGSDSPLEMEEPTASSDESVDESRWRPVEAEAVSESGWSEYVHEDQTGEIEVDVFEARDKATRDDSIVPVLEEERIFEGEIPDMDLGDAPEPVLVQVKPAGSLKWVPAVLLLLAVAGFQYWFFSMDRFAQLPEHRPYYLTVCRYLGCDVPEYDNVSLLVTRELVVRSHPDRDQALMIDVLLRNSGDFRQVFPGLQLRFYDISGSVVARRVFGMRDYLGGEMRGLRFIPAKTEVRISLDIMDPGIEAVGYEMDVVPN